jgi:UDP-glucose 4-epimerase
VALTGVHTTLGLRLASRLAAMPDGPDVLALDRRRPLALPRDVRFEAVDLSRLASEKRLVQALESAGVEALVHLAFRHVPTADHDSDRALETLGSRHCLAAVAEAGVRRFVMASSTMTYGPRPDNPNFLTESHPLHGHPDAHCVENRVEVERMVERWSAEHDEVDVCVLRGCWVVGPHTRDHVTRHLTRGTVPVVLGFDPLLQLVHEDDWLHAFEVAILEGVQGIFNVVGSGVEPLSKLLRSAGRRLLPLPSPLIEGAGSLLGTPSPGDPAKGFYDYLRYLWVADGSLGWSTFGEPLYSTQEAWASLVGAERPRRSA